MADDNRNDEAGRLAAADKTDDILDKAADDELTDDEMSEATGGARSYAKKPDEDAGPDGRFAI